ncbi:MAG: hypothetical protein COC15_03030 [Legionellales bacterium]|nr:MAG: hypothetical protein COC15_03030 [Legionellales bacterium]
MAVKKRKVATKPSKVKKAKVAKKIVKAKKSKATKTVKAKAVKKTKLAKKKVVAKKTKTSSSKVVPLNSNELIAKAAVKVGIPVTTAQELISVMMGDVAALLKKGYPANFLGVKVTPRKKAATKARTIHSPLLNKKYKIAAKPKHTVYGAKVSKRLEDLIE